ncbi:MAG: MGMT family protein [Gammaproteobacteria bacterium]|nr:MGMT family protein [Gammaproteobacteria bacterium]
MHHPQTGNGPSAGLYARIYQAVAGIPRGRVSSYGRIAKITGGCTARQVGYALSALSDESDVPWQRVVNSRGRISARSGGDSHQLQRWLLEDEGVKFGPGDAIDMGRFGWPDAALPSSASRDLCDA